MEYNIVRTKDELMDYVRDDDPVDGIVLMDDIDLEGEVLDNPVRVESTFRGLGNAIKNFTTTTRTGLFHPASRVLNLRIENAHGTEGNIVGGLWGGTTFKNVHVRDSISGNEDDPTANAGGISINGFNNDFYRCSFEGKVIAEEAAGGIFGKANYGVAQDGITNIEDCFTIGEIEITGSTIREGGLYGYADDTHHWGEVFHYLDDNFTAVDSLGGLIGEGWRTWGDRNIYNGDLSSTDVVFESSVWFESIEMSTSEMQGENAAENMSFIDEKSYWQTTEGYPTISHTTEYGIDFSFTTDRFPVRGEDVSININTVVNLSEENDRDMYVIVEAYDVTTEGLRLIDLEQTSSYSPGESTYPLTLSGNVTDIGKPDEGDFLIRVNGDVEREEVVSLESRPGLFGSKSVGSTSLAIEPLANTDISL